MFDFDDCKVASSVTVLILRTLSFCKENSQTEPKKSGRIRKSQVERIILGVECQNDVFKKSSSVSVPSSSMNEIVKKYHLIIIFLKNSIKQAWTI